MRIPLACLFGLGVLSLSAQEPQPTFRTATRIVEVEVVVTDSRGRPVRGLTRDDFTITEDRVPQEISVFHAAERPAPAVAARDGAVSARRFSNQPAASGVRTVILIDRANASRESQWHARHHVDRYLGAMSKADSVAIYVLGGASISALHDFSSDAASLRRALDRFIARTTGAYDGSTEEPDASATLGVWLADPAAAAAEFFLRRRQFATFDALEMIAEHLSGIAGRKNLIWVSEAFPMPSGDKLSAEFMYRLRRSARALSDAQVALYSVDARGLVGAMRLQAGKGSFPSHYGIVGNVETMQFYADETGGRAYAHTNDLAHSIGRAVDDTRESYVLGYRSTHPAPDGNYRSIAVKVARKGLIVRHRRGYWANAPQTDKKGREEVLRAVLQRPLAATGVRLSAEPTLDPATLQLDLRLLVDPASLSLDRDGARWTGTLDLLVAEVTGEGRATILEQRSLDLALTDDERERAREQGLPINVVTRITSGLRELRVVVRDPVAGTAGSLTIPAAALRTQGPKDPGTQGPRSVARKAIADQQRDRLHPEVRRGRVQVRQVEEASFDRESGSSAAGRRDPRTDLRDVVPSLLHAAKARKIAPDDAGAGGEVQPLAADPEADRHDAEDVAGDRADVTRNVPFERVLEPRGDADAESGDSQQPALRFPSAGRCHLEHRSCGDLEPDAARGCSCISR